MRNKIKGYTIKDSVIVASKHAKNIRIIQKVVQRNENVCIR